MGKSRKLIWIGIFLTLLLLWPVVQVNAEEVNYTYKYSCVDNIWTKTIYNVDTNEQLGTENCNPEDIPNGADISIYSTSWDEAVVLNVDVDNLAVCPQGGIYKGVNLTVNGNIKSMYVQAGEMSAYNLNINGNIDSLQIYNDYQYNRNLAVTGTVSNGLISSKNNDTVAIFSCNNMRIIQNGDFNPELYAYCYTGEDAATHFLMPTRAQIEDVLSDINLGEVLTENFTGEEMTVYKDVEVKISQLSKADADFLLSMQFVQNYIDYAKIAAENNGMVNPNAEVFSIMDYSISTFYRDKSTEEISYYHPVEDIDKFTSGKCLTVTFKVPQEHYDANARYTIIRYHVGSDGYVNGDELSVSQNGDVLTFVTDKIDKFLIVKLTEGEEIIEDEVYYELPFSTTYDITAKTFTAHLTLNTTDNLYLAYYKGNIYDSDKAFPYAVFTGQKSVDITFSSSGYDYTMFWVVDGANNLVAPAYPKYGNDVYKDNRALEDLYLYRTSRYYTDKAFSDAVQFTNGNDLSVYNLNAVFQNGYLTVSTPNINTQTVLYAQGYKNGELANDVSWYFQDFNGNTLTNDISRIFDESGEYTVVYWFETNGIRTKNQYFTYTYNRPQQQVGNAINIRWEEENPGWISFSPSYAPVQVVYFECRLEYRKKDESEFQSSYSTHTSYHHGYREDLSNGMTEEDCVYRVAIRLHSSDIERYAHSDWVYSGLYDESGETRAQVEAFVERMYTVVLGREAEVGGLDYWTDMLMNGSVDGASVANGFIMSDEFFNRGLDNEGYVTVLYQTFFSREPDTSGMEYWTQLLGQRKSRKAVLAGFVNSEEFDTLCTSYGIIRGTLIPGVVDIPEGIYDFVERSYSYSLGRDGDEAGVEYWVQRIVENMSEPQDVAKFFFLSAEYVEKNTSNKDYVKALYLTFVDREADASGLSFWDELLQNGTTREQVLEGFAYSEEFKKIMESYGL